MSKVKKLRGEIKSKLEIVKKINDDPSKASDNLYDLYLKDAEIDKKISDSIEGLKSKLKRKKDNKEDIFGSIIDIANDFLTTRSNKIQLNDNEKLLSGRKLKKYALESASITVKDSKNIVKESVKKVLFVDSDSSICGVDTEMPQDSMTISPKEFDFLNVLQNDPSSSIGMIMYEEESPSSGDIKMNRELYNAFSNNYTFSSKSGKNLFSLSWDSGNQEYQVSGLKQGIAAVKVGEFMEDYYDSIETPKIEYIIKTAMLMTLQGDGENPESFDKAMAYLNRLCSKLFKLCGSPMEDSGLIQTTSQQFSENDSDIQSYFDFDDVEGIDIDDEDDRYRKVLRFKDCGNFEIPSPQTSFEDFVFLSDGNLSNLVDDTLDSVALNAAIQSDNQNMFDNINLELLNMFILNVPKALVSSVLSPKVFYPLVVAYKQLKGVILDIKELMKKLYKLVHTIIKEVFWKFLTEFWKFIKKDLLDFVANVGMKILKNKYKHFVRILTAIIDLLRKLLTVGFKSCLEIFLAIIGAIKGALNLPGGKINVPGFILGFADILPGYSADRAYMNSAERASQLGLNTGTIYGEPNKYLLMMKSVIEGISEESDTNSFVKVSNKKITIPTPAGPLTIPPGILNSSGKVF